MSDPNLSNHALFKDFPKGWTTRAVGPVLFVFRGPVTVRLEDYRCILLDILNLKHDYGIVVTIEEQKQNDSAYVSCNIQAENGKQYIQQCYDIAMRIDQFFSGFNVDE